MNIFTCFECGFHYENDDPVECHRRGKHSGPCKDSTDSFHVFADIFKFHDDIHQQLKCQGAYETNSLLEDDMLCWYDDIQGYLQNFLDYQRHLAQVEDEALWDNAFCMTLPKHEAIVVLDFKMKILTSMYREKQ